MDTTRDTDQARERRELQLELQRISGHIFDGAYLDLAAALLRLLERHR